MTDHVGFNYDKFNEVAVKLRSLGHEVLNPAENFGGATEHPDGRKAFMRADIGHVLNVDAIVMLEGWEKSKGAKLELDIAKELELRVFDENLEPLKQEDILDEAKRLTSHERNNSYGPPTQDFDRTAKIWSAIIGQDINSTQVALCMIGLKLSRLTWSPKKRDSWADVAGYARCGAVCAGIHEL